MTMVEAPAYKVFHLLVPASTISSAEFEAAWAAHAPALAAAASSAPGFQYADRTPRTEHTASLGEFHGTGYSYAGVDVVSFSSAADALTFKSTMVDLASGFADPSSTCLVAKENILTNGAPIGPRDTGTGIKAITSLRRIAGMTLDDFRFHWLYEHGPFVVDTQGVSRYIQNHVIAEEYLSGEPRCDGFVEVWHRTRDDLNTCFADPMMTEVQAADIPTFIDTSTFYSIVCADAEQWLLGERPHPSLQYLSEHNSKAKEPTNA